MNTVYELRQGTTEPLAVTLYDGAVGANLAGVAGIYLFLRSDDGATQVTKSTSSGITVTTAASGIIALSFGATDLLFSKVAYNGYFIVVDGTGKRASFPNNNEIRIVMRERFSGDT